MFTFNTDEMDNVKRGYFRYPSAKISAENAKALSNCIVVHPDAGRSAATTFFCSGAPCVEPATPAMGASFPVQMLAHNDQGKTTTRNVQGRTLVGASIFPNATDKSRVIFQRTLPGSLIGNPAERLGRCGRRQRALRRLGARQEVDTSDRRPRLTS